MSVARGAEQREQQPGEVGDRNDVHLEDVAQLVAREVRDVPSERDPGGVDEGVEVGDPACGEGGRLLVGEVADEGLGGGEGGDDRCDRR